MHGEAEQQVVALVLNGSDNAHNQGIGKFISFSIRRGGDPERLFIDGSSFRVIP
jgi:hypothetical protein